jgi:hypothetical protein
MAPAAFGSAAPQHYEHILRSRRRYEVGRLMLPGELEQISVTDQRKQLGLRLRGSMDILSG